jgi:hypothetical protein
MLSAVKIFTGFGLNNFNLKDDPRIFPMVSVFDALILDRSEGGIRVDFGGTAHHLPEKFVVSFPDGSRQFGRIAWSSGVQAGIELSGPELMPEFAP